MRFEYLEVTVYVDVKPNFVEVICKVLLLAVIVMANVLLFATFALALYFDTLEYNALAGIATTGCV